MRNPTDTGTFGGAPDSQSDALQPSGPNGTNSEPSTEPVTCTRCGHVGEPVGKGQCAECRCWLPRNSGALVHGRRRYEETGLLPPELQIYLQEFRAAVVADLGGEESLSRIGVAMIDRLVELEASAKLMLDFALRTGADKKRARDALGAHRGVVDSQLRVARLLDVTMPSERDITPKAQWEASRG